VLLGALALLVGRALTPLKELEQALKRMEAGNYTARAATTESPDLHRIALRIDRLAENLHRAETQRAVLSQRVIDLRDAERKEIARELHDELGPCLFGLTVSADALRQGANNPERHLDMLDTLVERIRSTNVRILHTLRPTTVGILPLSDVISDLLSDFTERYPDKRFESDIEPCLPKTSETLDLTIYRITQEAITNALRHAQAGRILLRVASETRGPDPSIIVEVQDHGTGLREGWAEGRGLLGMRERIDAQGGRLNIGPFPGGGTLLCAFIPLDGGQTMGIA